MIFYNSYSVYCLYLRNKLLTRLYLNMVIVNFKTAIVKANHDPILRQSIQLLLKINNVLSNQCYFTNYFITFIKGSDDLVDKVSTSQSRGSNPTRSTIMIPQTKSFPVCKSVCIHTRNAVKLCALQCHGHFLAVNWHLPSSGCKCIWLKPMTFWQ